VGQHLTKKDLIRNIGIISGIYQDKARFITNAVLHGLVETLSSMNPGDRLEIRDLGIFTMKRTQPTLNRHNPKTMERVPQPARRKLMWKQSKLIKNRLKKF